MQKRIVFFDIDGTLLNDNKVIPESTKIAISELQKQGVYTAIATGRAPFHLRTVADELGIDSFVSFNGSYVVFEGQVIYEKTISSATLLRLESIANENSHPLVFLTNKSCYANRHEHPHIIESFQDLKLPAPHFDVRELSQTKVHQALLYCQSHEEPHYTEKFDDIHLLRWHKFSMDVLPQGGSKAMGIKAMLHHLGLTNKEAVAFGDGLNDIEMLKYVGCGVAMGNAKSIVKEAADYVTTRNSEDGILNGLRAIGVLVE